MDVLTVARLVHCQRELKSEAEREHRDRMSSVEEVVACEWCPPSIVVGLWQSGSKPARIRVGFLFGRIDATCIVHMYSVRACMRLRVTVWNAPHLANSCLPSQKKE